MIRRISDAFAATRRRLPGFGRDRKGVAAVEFALILPVMALLYVGVVEVTHAISANRKVIAAASALGDLTAQASNIDDTEMNNVFAATTAIMNPLTTAGFNVRVTQLMVNARGDAATVGWSEGRGMAALARGSAFSFTAAQRPVASASAGGALIFAEATYAYSSPLGSFIVGTFGMGESFFLRPRIGTCVQRRGACS
jgi:Flp pilus assembly protein TadG